MNTGHVSRMSTRITLPPLFLLRRCGSSAGNLGMALLNARVIGVAGRDWSTPRREGVGELSTTDNRSSTRWLRSYPGQPPAPAIRLFCFPYAGAGASIYRDWRLPSEAGVQVLAVQPPGRENRREVPPLRRIEPMLDACARELAPLADRPFAFFGHSMGALVAFELTRLLRRRGSPLPAHLFLSAHRAPDLPRLSHASGQPCASAC